MSINKLFSILAILLMMATACHKKDNCNDDCLNGRCVGDSCSCDPGFTGKYCDIYIQHGNGTPSSSGSSSSTSASGNGGPVWDLVIWKDFDGPPVKVSFGPKIFWGKEITKYYTTQPDCFAEGCARITPSYVGPPIQYNATDGTHVWQGEANYTGPCTMVKLEKP